MGPIDYNLDIQSPFQALMQGYSAGAGIRNDQQQFKLQQVQLANAQQQAASQQANQEQQAKVLQGLITNPQASAQDYANAMLVVPGLKDQLKQSWETKSKDQQQNQLNNVTQWASAIQTGNPQVAVSQMRQQADAMEASNGPTQASKILRTQADVVDAHPEFGLTIMKSLLAAHPDGEKTINAINALNKGQRDEAMAPADLQIKNAEATTKTAQAGVSKEDASLGIQQKREEIQSAQAKRDIDRLNVQIAQANSETQRGQLVLERDKLISQQKEKSQTSTQESQTQLDTLQRGLETIASIEKSPGLTSNGVGAGGVGSGFGKLAGLIPGSDRKDLEGLVDTLKSQEFLTGIQQMKGMGALSNAEGDKISTAVASLNLDQSEKAFRNSLGVIRANLHKGQAKLIASGKLPTQGGGFVVKHPQFGNVSEGDINRLLTSNPGSTREQVIQYLNSTGGK